MMAYGLTTVGINTAISQIVANTASPDWHKTSILFLCSDLQARRLIAADRKCGHLAHRRVNE
jgi:hypothetical protein